MTGKKAGVSEGKVRRGEIASLGEDGWWKWTRSRGSRGGGWRPGPERCRGPRSSSEAERTPGGSRTWKACWRTAFGTRIRPRRAGGASGMWDPRLVRLALLQQLRAVYGIKVKGGRGQCERRRRDPAATAVVVSSGGGDSRRGGGGELTLTVTTRSCQNGSFCMDPKEKVLNGVQFDPSSQWLKFKRMTLLILYRGFLVTERKLQDFSVPAV